MGRAKDPKPNSKSVEGYKPEEELEEEEAEDASVPSVAPDCPICPQCGWSNTRRSHTKGMLDKLLRTFSLRAFRCRTCGNRFRVIRRPTKT